MIRLNWLVSYIENKTYFVSVCYSEERFLLFI
jgi:hypothetical protein